jgi:hypothetical protein
MCPLELTWITHFGALTVMEALPVIIMELRSVGLSASTQ